MTFRILLKKAFNMLYALLFSCKACKTMGASFTVNITDCFNCEKPFDGCCEWCRPQIREETVAGHSITENDMEVTPTNRKPVKVAHTETDSAPENAVNTVSHQTECQSQVQASPPSVPKESNKSDVNKSEPISQQSHVKDKHPGDQVDDKTGTTQQERISKTFSNSGGVADETITSREKLEVQHIMESTSDKKPGGIGREEMAEQQTRSYRVNPDAVVLQEIASVVSRKIGSDWRDLGRELGLTVNDLDQIQIDNGSYGIQEMCQRMISKWKQKESKKATFGWLVKALTAIERNDVLTEYEK